MKRVEETMIWTAYAAVAIIFITTSIIYPLDAFSAHGEARWIHISGLLNGGCSDSIGEAVAAGIGNFGYGIAIALIGESFRRVYWTDDQRGKYWLGLVAALSIYLILGFPTGRSLGTDIVHHVSTGIGSGAFFLYALWSLDRRMVPIAFVQNLATLGMLLAGIALLVTYLTGEIDKMGWNGFVASQLAYGITFLIFLLSWGTRRNGLDRPRRKE